jgi:predicted small lipoprotein YifL
MLRVFQILVAMSALGVVAACGQRGPLYLPTGPGSEARATVTETLSLPIVPAAPASAPPVQGTAAPIRP